MAFSVMMSAEATQQSRLLGRLDRCTRLAMTVG